MAASYIAIIRKEPNTDYWVDVPDVPGCFSSGVTIEEAKAHFAEALGLHLKGTKEDGLSLKPPCSRDQVLADDQDPGIIESYVIEIEPF
jgi:predicted RNase H-like HicB family nuclease